SEGVKQAVMAGLGIAMVSRFAVTLEVQQGVLRVVPITDVHAERDLCLIWRHDSHLPASVRAFLHVLHEQAPGCSVLRFRISVLVLGLDLRLQWEACGWSL